MRKLLLVLLAACGSSGDGVVTPSASVQSATPDVDENALILAELDNGQPLMVRGHFRVVKGELSPASLAPAMESVATLLGVPSRELEFIAAEHDELGMGHARYQQTSNGLPVVGGDLKVHVDSGGRVFLLTGTSAVTKTLPTVPSFAQLEALQIAADYAREGVSLTATDGRLVYLVTEAGPLLAWEVIVEGENAEGPIRDRAYVDASTGEIAAVHQTIHFARNRFTYHGNNGSSLPGTLSRNEDSVDKNDAAIDAAHHNTGITYDAYFTLFNRDSYDNRGAALKATAHHRRNYVNAFWNGSQMVYGDGDNRTSIELSRALDVTAHELTHAVTEYTSGLHYTSGDTGSINEAMSDIFGAIVESWSRGWEVNAATWLVGEDIWTPGVADDALRYMANPTQDNYSVDDFKDMRRSTEVHSGSGVGNLAFALLVQGGRHPRGRSSVTVAGIGPEKAAQIFYRAQAQYLTSTSNYPALRAAAVQAATDLYGATSAEVASVNDAFSAVNIPGVGGGGGGGGGTALENGIAKTISGSVKSKTVYTVDVSAGETLSVETSGGSGDVDLYVRYNKEPGTWYFYDAKSTTAGNSESVTIPSTSGGRYYILVKAQEAYSDVSITARY